MPTATKPDRSPKQVWNRIERINRDTAIRILRSEGYTLAFIAKCHGLTVPRVSQICAATT